MHIWRIASQILLGDSRTVCESCAQGGRPIVNEGLAGSIAAYRRNLVRRSAAIPRLLERLTFAFTIAWAGVFFLFAALRINASPHFDPHPAAWLGLLVPYAFIALAPLAGFALGEAAFPKGERTASPGASLAQWGRWRRLKLGEVRLHPLFGPAGFMASLLIGLLLNMVLRSFEFLLAMPALTYQAPGWGRELFLLMAADVGVMAFFYMVAFAFALHAVTLFPRMLGFAWLLDILLQLLIAQRIGAMPDLPAEVAAPLAGLLHGNILKVLISAMVWLPYLLLSERVNVTYRHRVRGVDQAQD